MLVTTAVLIGCHKSQTAAPADVGIPVQIARPRQGTVTESDEYVARYESRHAVSVRPRVEGLIRKINVNPGARVSAGRVLLEIDSARQAASLESYQRGADAALADLERARSVLRTNEADVVARQSDLSLARQQLDRYTRLEQKGVISRQALEERTNQFESAQARQRAGESTIEAQRADITRLDREVERARAAAREQGVTLTWYAVQAPFTGVVGDVPVKLGDYVTTTTLLTSVTQSQPIEVAVSIPVTAASRLSKGGELELLDGETNLFGTAHVFFIAPRADEQSQTVLVKALYPNLEGRVRDSQIGRARAIWGRKQGLLIPAAAIQSMGGQSLVYAANHENGRLIARQRLVKLGTAQGNWFPVMEGLSSADRVVVSGVQSLAEGVLITSR